MFAIGASFGGKSADYRAITRYSGGRRRGCENATIVSRGTPSGKDPNKIAQTLAPLSSACVLYTKPLEGAATAVRGAGVLRLEIS